MEVDVNIMDNCADMYLLIHFGLLHGDAGTIQQ